MDPIAHTFTGMALAAAGLRRATPLAATALFMGVNAPDVDVFVGFMGEYQSTAFRRGWTHGVLALAVWPFVLTGVLLAWDRYVRLRRRPDAAPARAGPLLALTALAVLTHPTLDWLNNYGLRWLMPFDGRWFYGDALFVIDPWVWLLLGGAAFLTFSRANLARWRWAAFCTLATLLIVGSSALVPVTSVVLWLVGVAALVAARWWLRDAPPAVLERAAQAGLAVTAVYMAALVGAGAAARAEVRAAVAAQGIEAEDVMVAPAPADPFGGPVVVMTRDDYYTGRFNWLTEPRLRLDEERIPRPSGVEYQMAAQTPAARRFLVWSRYPAVDLELVPDGGGVRVTFSDVRYRAEGRLVGPTVHLLGSAVGDGAN
ncbi:MAG TPA: metal-dependent hydrolase [Rhodanobacteraceae bacterium]|nr:metal-dependent hydrolase [Rhodanobacteraceae bacterium]